MTALSEIETAEHHQDYMAANALVLREIEMFGTDYLGSAAVDTMDDTDLRLGAAAATERRGDLVHALSTRRSVLENRVQLYQQHVCKGGFAS